MEVKAAIYLFLIALQRVSSLQESLDNADDVTDVVVDFERIENEYALGNVSTGTEAYENTTVPETSAFSTAETPETVGKLENVTEFKPSVHLGEIQEFRVANSNPFNKPSHLKFDNFISVQQDAGNWQNAPPGSNETNYFNKINIDNNINLTPPEPKFFPTSNSNEHQYLPTHNGAPPFAHPPPPFQGQNLITTGFQDSLHLSLPLQRPEFAVNSPDKTFFESTYAQEISPPFNHPGSFHDQANYVASLNDGQNFEYPHQPSFQNYEEPSGLKIYPEIQEIAPTRNQRFPYKFYHETPTFMGGNLEYVAEEQFLHNVPRERRISPWKKLIHLIGTILPFGLLLATLSPNVIQISNSTQSTIPLSKLKDVNLPPEHKSLRMSDDPINTCEEKNICQVILAGSRPRSNLLQNVLWNFVVRTPEETAKDNGLRELFQAVKKRDCNLITC